MSAPLGRRPHFLTGPHSGAFRPPAYGYGGVVASAHGLATAAGVEMLLAGGSAVNAAVAVAAALTIVEPYMSSLGGGGGIMLITRPDGTTTALDYLGQAPRAATNQSIFTDQEQVRTSPRWPSHPRHDRRLAGGAARYGRLDRARLFGPAMRIADRGAPVTSTFAAVTASSAGALRQSAPAASTFLPSGAPPAVGQVIRQPAVAASMRLIADQGPEVFYRGELGERFVAALAAQGGILTMDDLADFELIWHEPMRAPYRGLDAARHATTIDRIPDAGDVAPAGRPRPAGAGGRAGRLPPSPLRGVKLARADRAAHALGPRAGVETLLSDAYIAERRRLIDPRRAAPAEGDRFMKAKPAGMVRAGSVERAPENTNHFCVADRDGLVGLSVTHSLGAAYGCGIMAGDTGIMVNDFGYWLDINPDSPNAMAPGKKMEDPMGPVGVLRDGQLVLAIGTPGSFGIPQTIAQEMLMNVLDFGLNIQAAIEAPRVKLTGELGRGVQVESSARSGRNRRPGRARPCSPGHRRLRHPRRRRPGNRHRPGHRPHHRRRSIRRDGIAFGLA